jgi:GxxExxY protein
MLKHHDLTDRIIKAFYKVYNKLGYGFPEKVYHNALSIELSNQGMAIQFQPPLQVHYEGHIVGDFFPDLVVNSLVIVELKGRVRTDRGTRDATHELSEGGGHRSRPITQFRPPTRDPAEGLRPRRGPRRG